MTLPELEISLHPTTATACRIELRYTDPHSGADERSHGHAHFDLDHLRHTTLDPIAYGRALTTSLVADPAIRTSLAYIRGHTSGQPIRIRFHIPHEATDFHTIRWETLRDIHTDTPILTSDYTCFSRYLSSANWRPITLRPHTALRTLIVIANPTDLSDYTPDGMPLAALDVPNHLAHIHTSLSTIPTTTLAANGTATIPNLIAHLRDSNGYDILILIAHGITTDNTTLLWLEHPDGTANVITSTHLVAHLHDIQHLPRLAVLASCQSAGTTTALGPQLAQAGIPAVLAMHDTITIKTTTSFLTSFFTQLQHDGCVDRAVAVARSAVRDRPDWWMPVLYSRLHDGTLWPTHTDHDIQTALTQALTAYQTHIQQTIIFQPDITHPYQSLYPFTIEDTTRFFGRTQARTDLHNHIRTNRLTILHARSGAGKTSLINAGIIPHLIKDRILALAVRTHNDPIQSLKHTLAHYIPTMPTTIFDHLSLHHILTLACRTLTIIRELIIIFDQFEELFTTTSHDQRTPILEALAACHNDTTLPIRFVLSIRGDYLSDLADIQSYIPTIFHHQYRLDPMNRIEAQQAIEEPLRLINPPRTYEPALLNHILTDLERSGSELPHLQIICTALYDTLPSDTTTITFAHYQEQGTAQRILGTYLRRQIELLGDHAPLARTILAELISTNSTRQARTYHHIHTALIQRDDHDQIENVLDKLIAARLIQRHERDGTPWYELAHDYLISDIRTWITPDDLAARRARELLQHGTEHWHTHGWLLDEAPLTFIYQHRQHITNLQPDHIELLLRSAVHHQNAIDTWVQVAHYYGIPIQPILMPLLTARDHRTRANVIAMLPILGTTVLHILHNALSDPAPLVRVNAITAIEHIAATYSNQHILIPLIYEVAIPSPNATTNTSNPFPAFYIDRYPVRNKDYAFFLADNPTHDPPSSWHDHTFPRDRADHPVTGVSWHDANAYAAWAGKRLPSADEWIQAAGGTATPYPWGTTFSPHHCNTSESHIGTTTPVTNYSPHSDSPHGVADMIGNVWEWLADPAGPNNTYRQLRAGAWMYGADFARIDFNLCWRPPDLQHDAIGFRLCFDSTHKEKE